MFTKRAVNVGVFFGNGTCNWYKFWNRLLLAVNFYDWLSYLIYVLANVYKHIFKKPYPFNQPLIHRIFLEWVRFNEKRAILTKWLLKLGRAFGIIIRKLNCQLGPILGFHCENNIVCLNIKSREDRFISTPLNCLWTTCIHNPSLSVALTGLG